MGLTFAANGVYLGMAAGLLAGIATKSAAVGVVVAVGASVAAWYGIRAIEKMLGRGLSAGFTAAQNRLNRPPPLTQYPPLPPQYGHQPPVQQNGHYPPSGAPRSLGQQAPRNWPGQR